MYVNHAKLNVSSSMRAPALMHAEKIILCMSTLFSLRRCVFLNSINAVGVDISKFSTMSDEEEVLLLPGLPLVNRPGENPEPDLWTFEVETPDASSSSH